MKNDKETAGSSICNCILSIYVASLLRNIIFFHLNKSLFFGGGGGGGDGDGKSAYNFNTLLNF